MMSCAWLWIYAGCALMLLELIVPGFVLCFFGLSAATVGALRFFFGELLTPTGQLAAFSVCSILYIVLLRHWLKKTFTGEMGVTKTDFDHESVGRCGKVTEAIRPPLSGRILLGDAEWTAIADASIDAGSSVKVISQNNLTMKVKEL